MALNQDIAFKSRVMNDEILGHILKDLRINQVIRLESVSQQFMDCVSTALKSWDQLIVGKCLLMSKNCCVECKTFDISGAFDHKSHYPNQRVCCYDLTRSGHLLDSFLQKCPNIQFLSLGFSPIDFKTLEMIVNCCPQLGQLTLMGIQMVAQTDEECIEWQKLLSQSKVVCITLCEIEGENLQNLLKVIEGLPSLKSFSIGSDDMIMFAKYLPKSLRYLSLRGDFNGISMETLVTRCAQLDELSITDYAESQPQWDRQLAKVCDNLQLKKFSFSFNPLDAFDVDVITENISKLKDNLNKLTLEVITEFDTTLMQSMTSLKTLKMKGMLIWPQLWSNLPQMAPNVSHLFLKVIYIFCECNARKEPNQCNQCLQEFLKYVSKMPKLKRLDIKWIEGFPDMDSQSLNLFTELNVLTLDGYKNVKQLVAFIQNCIEKRMSKKNMSLDLDKSVRNELMDTLKAMGVSVPKYLFI